ncbi:MAG TPA: hypothetical protein VIZ28_14070 [Chitinophagaceae bacterium]
MRNYFPAHFLLAVLVCSGMMATAQSKQEKKYAERATEVDAEIFNSVDAAFTGNTVPATYAQSSGVIIAKKVDLFADLKSKVKFSIFYGTDKTNTIRYTLTIREKIKIQDKNALSEYSEFAFSKIRSQSSFFKSSAYSFVGIRLIKPDGTIKKIDVDEEAVNAESEDEKNKYKLAIPGLQVGDIIDMYSRVEKESSSSNPIEPLDIVVGGSYPVVNYSFITKVRNSFAIIYSIANSSTKLNETRDAEFIYLKMNMQDVNKKTDDLWVYERRELPVFKINIFPGASSKYENRTYAPAEGKVLDGLPKEWIDNKFSTALSGSVNSRKISEDRTNWLKENIKRVKKERGWKDMDSDSMILYIYYFGRFSFLYDYMSESKIEVGIERNMASTNYAFYDYLVDAFNYYNIDYDLIFTVPRSNGTIYTTTDLGEFDLVVRAKGRNDYYLSPPGIFSIANSFPASYEGQDAYVFKNTSIKRSGGVSVVEKLPVTKPSFNYLEENLDISVNATNNQQVNISRTRTLRGKPAYETQVMLSLFEEYVDKERKLVGERTFAEEIVARVGKKRSAQLLAEYEQAFQAARKKRLEYAKEELEGSFENKTVTLDSFQVIKPGNRHVQPDFVFKESFTMTGLVKKAGNNYIISLGELVSGQVQVKTDQRTRTNNINMPYARHYRYKISFTIPEGFTAEGIENLNKEVSNETGSFSSKAVLQNDKLVVEINKIYTRSYEPAANWDKMLGFLDAAYNLSQEKILLKKK